MIASPAALAECSLPWSHLSGGNFGKSAFSRGMFPGRSRIHRREQGSDTRPGTQGVYLSSARNRITRAIPSTGGCRPFPGHHGLWACGASDTIHDFTALVFGNLWRRYEGVVSVQIKIATRHGTLSGETQSKVIAKLERLPRIFERLSAIEVTVDLEHRDARIAIGITHKPTLVPNAIAAADGQPTSTTSRVMPRFFTSA